MRISEVRCPAATEFNTFQIVARLLELYILKLRFTKIMKKHRNIDPSATGQFDRCAFAPK